MLINKIKFDKIKGLRDLKFFKNDTELSITDKVTLSSETASFNINGVKCNATSSTTYSNTWTLSNIVLTTTYGWLASGTPNITQGYGDGTILMEFDSYIDIDYITFKLYANASYGSTQGVVEAYTAGNFTTTELSQPSYSVDVSVNILGGYFVIQDGEKLYTIRDNAISEISSFTEGFGDISQINNSLDLSSLIHPKLTLMDNTKYFNISDISSKINSDLYVTTPLISLQGVTKTTILPQSTISSTEWLVQFSFDKVNWLTFNLTTREFEPISEENNGLTFNNFKLSTYYVYYRPLLKDYMYLRFYKSKEESIISQQIDLSLSETVAYDLVVVEPNIRIVDNSFYIYLTSAGNYIIQVLEGK